MNTAVTFFSALLGRIQNRFPGPQDRGATLVEYGLLVGLISVMIIVAVTALGVRLSGLFAMITTALGG